MRVLLLKTYLNAQEIQQMVFSDTRMNRSKTNITCITVIITPPYVEHNMKVDHVLHIYNFHKSL